MERTFKEVIDTIKEGETWVVKNKSKRLTKIQKFYDNVSFIFNDNYADVAINLNDTYVLERKKYTFEEAMKALKEGKEIESCYSKTKYRTSPNRNENVKYFDTMREVWRPSLGMFTCQEIFGEWYIL